MLKYIFIRSAATGMGLVSRIIPMSSVKHVDFVKPSCEVRFTFLDNNQFKVTLQDNKKIEQIKDALVNSGEVLTLD